MDGDPANGAAIIGPPLTANEQRQAQRARSNRADKLKSLLHKHITSSSIQGEIDTAAADVRGYEAAVAAAGGPLAAAAAAIPLPSSYGRYGATGVGGRMTTVGQMAWLVAQYHRQGAWWWCPCSFYGPTRKRERGPWTRRQHVCSRV